MDFALSEEQSALADVVARYLARNYSFDARQMLAASERGYGESHWKMFAELGLLGLMVPQEYGGMGADSADLLVVMEAFGRARVLEPYIGTCVMAVAALKHAGTPAQKGALLPAIAAAERTIALAALEPHARFDLANVRTRALADGKGFVLSGAKSVVLHGASSDTLIVSARTAASGTTDDLALFLVDARASGVKMRSFPGIDGVRTAEIALEGVRVGADALLGARSGGHALLEYIVDCGIAALCAEAVGTMHRLIEFTTEHLRTRQQFGQPLGRFQALSHRVADMLIAGEQARSAALIAAAKIIDDDPRERRRALAAAKFTIGRSGAYIGQQAVQLHGGMGMTDELPVGHYFKRLTCIDMSFGNSDHHLERFAALL